MATTAESPRVTNSKPEVWKSLIHPVPAADITAMWLRSKAPVRCISLIATAAMASKSGVSSSPKFRPTKMRIGSIASPSSRRSMSALRGPPATTARPWRPIVSQSTSESGEPERSARCGWSAPRMNSRSSSWACRLTRTAKRRTTIWSPTKISRAPPPAIASGQDATGGSFLPNSSLIASMNVWIASPISSTTP